MGEKDNASLGCQQTYFFHGQSLNTNYERQKGFYFGIQIIGHKYSMILFQRLPVASYVLY